MVLCGRWSATRSGFPGAAHGSGPFREAASHQLSRFALLHIRRIESLDLPELAPYRSMRQQVEHWRQRIFVAEGEKVVRRLLESRCTVVSLLLPQKWLQNLEPLLRVRPEDIQVYVAEKKLL